MSVPLKAAGFSTINSFFWGQASGMVEPIAGIIGEFIQSQIDTIHYIALRPENSFCFENTNVSIDKHYDIFII